LWALDRPHGPGYTRAEQRWIGSLSRTLVLCLVLLVAACKPDYSANSYNSNAVQQANKVDQGVVIGRRLVGVTDNGAAGAVTGAAAGGIAGSQAGNGVTAAFGALGGGVVGGLVGSAVQKTSGATHAYEYVVRKPNGDLLSVTQQDATPLEVGQNVLVIAGNQARIVPDYTVKLDPAPPAAKTDATAPPPPPVAAAPLTPPAEPAAAASPAPSSPTQASPAASPATPPP
jgi:outer membrane lipoprotein SlyB